VKPPQERRYERVEDMSERREGRGRWYLNLDGLYRDLQRIDALELCPQSREKRQSRVNEDRGQRIERVCERGQRGGGG
jgi:hypothetical protein